MIGYLEQLPALALLHRLPIPMLAVCVDGIIVYANPAFLAMLGHTDTSVSGRPMNQFLDIGANATPTECVQTLGAAAGTTTAWRHRDRGTVKAVTSQPVLMRDDDPVLLIALTDVTERLWTLGPNSSPPSLLPPAS